MQCKVVLLDGNAQQREKDLNFWLMQGWKLVSVSDMFAYLVK